MVRDQILAIKLESTIANGIKASPEALRSAIAVFWPKADISDTFQPIGPSENRWYQAQRDSCPTWVRYNIFTGCLLVGGKPLSALPETYTQEKLYRQVFGDRLLDVVASSHPMMEYMSSSSVNGCDLHLGFKAGQLEIFANKDGEWYVAIDRQAFGRDLPLVLVQDLHPWLYVSTSTVEFRRSDAPWSERPEWTLQPVRPEESIYKMQSDKSALIDNRRGIGKSICSILEHFELAKYVHVLADKTTGTISVELPRYRLNFVLESSGRLKCNELAAVISPNQALGTLHGLCNRLVLQSRGSEISNPKRWVLIPFGECQTQIKEHHVSVDIDIDESDYVDYFQYTVDSTLGVLSSDVVEAHLWKAYLHALTSSCLADRLTEHTGVEESFVALQDSLVRTCVPFSVRAQQILQMISQLAPVRSFYPPESKQMATVIWNSNLPFYTQHDRYYKIVHDITSHNHKVQFLHADTEFVIPAYPGSDEGLVLATRAQYGREKFHRTGFIADELLPDGDKIYDSRDRELSRDVEPMMRLAITIDRWKASEWDGHDIYTMLEKWPTLNGFHSTFSVASLTEALSVKIEESWPSMLTSCFLATEADKWELFFTMSLVAFGNPGSLPQLSTLMCFAMDPALKEMGLPEEEEYDLSEGFDMEWSTVAAIINACQIPLAQHLAASDHNDELFDDDDFSAVEVSCQRAAIERAVRQAWPFDDVELEPDEVITMFDLKKLLPLLNGRIGLWAKNLALQQHCKAWEISLKKTRTSESYKAIPSALVHPSNAQGGQKASAFPSLLQRMIAVDVSEIASRRPQSTDFDKCISLLFASNDEQGTSMNANQTFLCTDLENLIRSYTGSTDQIALDYKQALLDSIDALREQPPQTNQTRSPPDAYLLKDKLDHVKARVRTLLDLFAWLCTPKSAAEHGLHLAELWPKVTTSSLLQLLSRKFRSQVSDQWKILLIGFAREVTARQRMERMIRLVEANDQFALRKELENTAHHSWILHDNLDWLLIEIQNDILIRPVQISVAREMIKPSNGVLQLQMGDGKSSVILPMFCTAVANDGVLVRVIVLKALAKETLRSLSKALSGLVGRPVYWLPFSRGTKVTKSTAGKFRALWKECRLAGGVLLALPEHLNSFRLIGNDQLISGRVEIARSLLSAQKWLDQHARDIIDESDEVLKALYELVYTSGEDKPLQGTPYRWTVLLSILDLIQDCAEKVHAEMPHAVEFKNYGTSRYAYIRILDDQGGVMLLEAIFRRLWAGHSAVFALTKCKIEDMDNIKQFVLNRRIKGQLESSVKAHFDSPEEKITIYLLRGLFAWGHLTSAFKKRFFVEYGLDRSRCLSAVPYRSKGVPSNAAEFAQPDMMILLTALGYYYSGLDIEDLRTILGILLRMPDPQETYARWISESTVPAKYQNISSINLQDDSCIDELYGHLRNCKTAIDFFLKTVALVKESKEYPFKLSSSALDLVAGQGAKSGFSGTVDSLMPNSMPHKALRDLQHFDAAVLVNLLQPRNRRYLLAGTEHGTAFQTQILLDYIGRNAPNVSVIIDVGAQTLDQNEVIARMWLQLRDDKLAAIFFNEHDEKTVVTRDGPASPFVSSPFKEQIHKCILLFDQHHCRGADFSLPDDFAAAVLLGPGLQKDAWVQACMRMRKLGFGQQVCCVATPEVDINIRAVLSKSPGDNLDVTDVIKWTIHNSCRALQDQRTMQTIKGLEHMKRYKAFERQVDDHGAVKNRAVYIESVRTTEATSVEALYPVGVNSLAKPPIFTKHERADPKVQKLLREWEMIDKSSYWELSRFDEAECERYMELEQEREVQRPKSMNAKFPLINAHLQDIVTSDRNVQIVPEGTTPVFKLMECTSLHNDPLVKKWPTSIVATQDFLFAVKSTTGVDHDDFLRPVYWILKLKQVRQLILIGPHEAQAWLPYLRKSTVATLAMYSAKLTKEMKSFDSLDIYTVPERAEAEQLRFEVDPDILTCLRIFAGQLYFNNFDEYERFCVLLGLPYNSGARPHNNMGGSVQSSMLKLSRKTVKKENFVPMVKKWIDMRRKGVEWSHTHVGRVLGGERLTLRDFEVRN